jgi:DNA adenine methylase
VRHPLPFRYPGGKYYAIDILRPFWEVVSHDEYREPFMGGGSVFFNKEKASCNWINDIDDELITAYRTMQCPELRNKLIKMVEKEEASKERWREIVEFSPSNFLEIAYKYYYLNRTSFSGKLISPAWGYRPKRSLPPERWHERIIPSGEKLENVVITTVDFEEVILSPAKNSLGQVLIFADPPYFGPAKKKHYRNGFTNDDHVRLMKTLQKCNHKFFLTYDDVPEIHELYDWANIYRTKFFYRVDNSNIQEGSRRLGFELIITNYDVNCGNVQYELAG